MTMPNNCAQCGHLNRIGMLFCEECGVRLLPASTIVPQAEPAAPAAPTVETPVPAGIRVVDKHNPASWGTSQLADASRVRLRFHHTARTLPILPTEKLIVGRVDLTNAAQPDVDLVPYGALENGVSRLHASLELLEDNLMLSDLGSSNGTYVNGQRLTPHQPRLLRDGDEITFGKLVAYLHFS